MIMIKKTLSGKELTGKFVEC